MPDWIPKMESLTDDTYKFFSNMPEFDACK